MIKLGLSFDQFEENFSKGGGKGGQKINKSVNAVNLKHLPTGISVKVQKFRELWGNRLSAYRLIIDKIEDLKLGKSSTHNLKLLKIKKQKKRRQRKSKEKLKND